MSGDPLYGKDPGGVPPPGRNMYCGATPPEMIRWDLALPTDRVNNESGRYVGTGYLHRQEVEHSVPVHCNSAHSGPLSGGGE